MRTIALIFIILCSDQIVSAQTKQELAVLNLSKKKFEWLIRKQADSLKQVLDDRLMFVHSSGWSQTKQEVLDDMTSGSLVYTSVDVKEAAVRLYDKSAIVVGKGRFSGNREGNGYDIELCYTEVYVWENKGWRLASRHANRLP